MSDVQIIKPSVEFKHIENYKKPRKKRVCAYCRVSTDLEEQRTSYYSQINHYSDYIKKNKDWEFVGVYADDGITGTQIKNRDEFIRMIEDCKSGLIDIIIAKSISRFARNTVDTLNVVRLLRNLDIDVYFEKENIHTLNMDSEMFLTLYSAFAQAESESTSQNVKMGYRAKMKRGEPCGTIACYGFIWDKNTKILSINKTEAEIIKKIFSYYIEGFGSSIISKKLNDEKVKAPDGGNVWHPSVIRQMLRNVKYVGDLCGQRFFVENPISHKLLRNRGQKPMYYVRNHHEAIIDRETFEKAQEIYNSRSIKIKDGKEYCEKYSLRYTFSSMIYCQYCGHTYVRRCTKYKNKNGITHNHIYWTCSSKLKNKHDECGKAVTIRDEEIKSLFVSLFNSFLNHSRNDDLIKKIKDVIVNDNSEEKIKKIEKKIENTKDKLSKLIDLNISVGLSHDVFVEKNRELNQELLKLEKEKNEISNSKFYIKKEEKRLKEIIKELDKTTTIYKFDEEIFKKLVSKIIIGDYDENNNYNPNVVKFVLKLKSPNSDGENKFLSLEVDERVCSSEGVRMRLESRVLKEIHGGEISGSLISSVVKGITILLELGRSLGSSIRRLIDKDICFYE